MRITKSYGSSKFGTQLALSRKYCFLVVLGKSRVLAVGSPLRGSIVSATSIGESGADTYTPLPPLVRVIDTPCNCFCVSVGVGVSVQSAF